MITREGEPTFDGLAPLPFLFLELIWPRTEATSVRGKQRSVRLAFPLLRRG